MILDLENNPIAAGSVSLGAGDNTILSIRIDCRAGYYLRAAVNAALTIEARRAGDSVWINLNASEIELTPFSGSRVEFEIQLTAAAASTGIESVSLKVER